MTPEQVVPRLLAQVRECCEGTSDGVVIVRRLLAAGIHPTDALRVLYRVETHEADVLADAISAAIRATVRNP